MITSITWESYSDGQLTRTPAGTWRTGNLAGRYHRHVSRERFAPPYTLRARIRVHHRQPGPPVWIPSEQRWSTWDHGIVVHPAHADNDHNWNLTTSPTRTDTGLFTELGGRSVFTWSQADGGSIFRGPPAPFYDGGWHTIEVQVPEPGRVRYLVDGVLRAEGREGRPSFTGPVQVGFRLDFHDVELADVTVQTPDAPTPDVDTPGEDATTMRYDFTLEDWQEPARPVVGPYAFLWSAIRYVALHFIGGGPNFRPGPTWDVAQHLRNGQHSYLVNRGYSYGYNIGVVSIPGHPLDGTAWEIRGTRFRGAATAGVNAIVLAIYVMQRDGEPLTAKARATIMRLINEAQAEAARAHPGRLLEVYGHNEVPGGTTRTSCPGPGIRAAIADGLGPGLVVVPDPDPDPDPEPEVIEMPPFLVQDPQIGGGLFAPDGTPVSARMRDHYYWVNGGELPIIQNTHPEWRNATLEKMGRANRQRYGGPAALAYVA